MRKIVIPYVKGGGGHRATAKAIVEISKRQGRPWDIHLLDVDKTLEPTDPVHRILRVEGGAIYNWLLRRGWTFGSEALIRLMQTAYRMLHPAQVLIFRQCWRDLRPDLVLSVTPHINRALFESLQKEIPGTPLVTLLTDLADLPPRYWFEPQDQHFICGSDRAIEQGRAIVGPKSRLWRVSGMVLNPKFYEPRTDDHAGQRQQLGLDPDLPTGMVLFGGNGSNTMVEIAQLVTRAKTRVQLIFLCGHNRKLAEQLRSLKLPYPFHVQEFTDDVVHFMGLCDFFIGKPGPASISEALAMGLPMIVQRSFMTLAQERYNIDWIEEQGVGIAVKGIRDIPEAIAKLLEPAGYAQRLRKIETLTNRAIFEVPEIVARILDQPRIVPERSTVSYEGVGARALASEIAASSSG